MDEPENNNQKAAPKPTTPHREIGNANLFADDIIFSDTEKILFEEDLKEKTKPHAGLMDGNPADRYTPNKKLNQGGMKAIWEVDDHRTARKVAMALIQDSKIASEEDIDSFLYEARLTANLQHPNIIPIYDIAVDEDGNPYFTMKALKGETLGEIIRKRRDGDEDYVRRYSRTRLLGIFLKVCNAIDYAHTKGVIHLDLKPSNVIVGDFGDVHVLDWGLSTLITHLQEYDGEAVSWQSMDDVALENGQTLTRYLESSAKRRHVVGGTPGYMSPEQAQGSPSDIDFQTDIYTLGAMLYEILTGQCPILGDTVREVLQKTVRGDIPRPIKRNPEQRIPPALDAIAMKALQLDPRQRYANVAALIHDIHQYQDGFATTAENPTFITHFTLLIRRHKLAVSLIALFSLLIATILTNSYISIRNALTALQDKNDYIEATAKKVAPDYLDLMHRAERAYAFAAAEQALDTSLAFDPANPAAQQAKVQMQLSRKTRADAEIPQQAAEFRRAGMNGTLPRLFYHYNQASFDPPPHFAAIADSLRLLNPSVEELKFSWSAADNGGWNIDISKNPGLDDLTPLCGLKITRLIARDIGSPDMALLTENGMRTLDLSNAQINHLPDLNQLTGLEELDISGTRIRNIANIIKYPRLSTLNISHIEGLNISPQLVWCRNLKLLTVSAAFKNDSTVQTLARRGVIIIYTSN
jgi:serine/threonine protein kinase